MGMNNWGYIFVIVVFAVLIGVPIIWSLNYSIKVKKCFDSTKFSMSIKLKPESGDLEKEDLVLDRLTGKLYRVIRAYDLNNTLLSQPPVDYILSNDRLLKINKESIALICEYKGDSYSDEMVFTFNEMMSRNINSITKTVKDIYS